MSPEITATEIPPHVALMHCMEDLRIGGIYRLPKFQKISIYKINCRKQSTDIILYLYVLRSTSGVRRVIALNH